jgi:hypothetical protein
MSLLKAKKWAASKMGYCSCACCTADSCEDLQRTLAYRVCFCWNIVSAHRDTKLGRAQAVKLVGEDGYTILAAVDAVTEKCTYD